MNFPESLNSDLKGTNWNVKVLYNSHDNVCFAMLLWFIILISTATQTKVIKVDTHHWCAINYYKVELFVYE
jgi:hypothetical protein